MAPFTSVFSSSCVSSGWVFCPSWATSPRTVTFGRLPIWFLKSLLWAETAAGGEAPRGGGGEGGGKGRTAAPVLLSPPPRPPLHIGVPAPPAGGWLPSWGARLIHSEAGCYGPGRVADAAARWGTRPAPLGAAPAPGSRMCRCGWDPLPPPWGSSPRAPGRDRSSGPSSASSHHGAAG